MILPIQSADLAKLVEAELVDPDLPGGKVWIFDLREAEAFVEGHVPGAHHLPHEGHYPIRWIPQRCKTQELVVLIDDDAARGGPARHVAHELAHRWFRRLRYLAGGYPSWVEGGHPTEQGGPTGAFSASAEGAEDDVHSSSDVPWETPHDL